MKYNEPYYMQSINIWACQYFNTGMLLVTKFFETKDQAFDFWKTLEIEYKG